MKKLEPNLRLVAWEVTSACNLACKHCRAEAKLTPNKDELTSLEGKKLLESIAEVGKPIVIFTGGEPLMREDIFDLISYAKFLGLKPVLSPNGTLITGDIAKKIKDCGITRISISIDGPDSKSHNEFRGVEGAFEKIIEAISYLKENKIEFQINTTVTKSNLNSFKEIFNLVKELGAVAWHIFLLVPTGRATEIQDQIISAEEYEKVLNWFYDFRKIAKNIHLKATCAPHYYRILRQRAKEEGIKVNFENFGLDAVSRGCLGGIGFCFVSNNGIVQPCGYLRVSCGNIRKQNFKTIWEESPIFEKLRNPDCYKGKCSICEYFNVCGGCRARAYTMLGDYLDEEPLCSYKPKRMK